MNLYFSFFDAECSPIVLFLSSCVRDIFIKEARAGIYYRGGDAAITVRKLPSVFYFFFLFLFFQMRIVQSFCIRDMLTWRITSVFHGLLLHCSVRRCGFRSRTMRRIKGWRRR